MNKVISLFKALNRFADRTPDIVALRETDRSLTYSQLRQQVHVFSKSIRQLQAPRPIAVFGPNTLEWHVIHLAALQNGIPVWGVDPTTDGEIFLRQWKQVNPACIWVEKKWRDKLPLSKLPPLSVKYIEPVSFGKSTLPDAPFIEPTGSSSATLVWTSGTTGDPKCIRHTYSQLNLALSVISENLVPIRRSISWLPLSQLFQRISDLLTLCQGGEVFLSKGPLHIFEETRRFGPDFLIAVPKILDKVRNRVCMLAPWIEPLAATSNFICRAIASLTARVLLRSLLGRRIQFFISGSAALNPRTEKLFDAGGIPVLQAYGTSECIVPIAMNSLSDKKKSSVGRPTQPHETSIAADGEILIRSQGISPDVNSDRYLRTGDCGHLDDQGFLFLTGRKSDVFKLSNGRKVHPAPLEAIVESHPAVESAILCPSAEGEFIVSITAVLPEASGTTESLLPEIQALFRHQPKYCIPQQLILCGPFSVAANELTPNLKKRRRVIEQKYLPRKGQAA